MIYPNYECYIFCQWLLNSEYQRFSSARVQLISLIRNAANAGTPVSLHNWNQFVSVTGIYWQPFQVYYKLQPIVTAGTTYDPLTTAWLATVASPSIQTIYAVDTFFKQLRNDGNLLLDYLFLFAQDIQANANISLINPALYSATPHNSPTWAANLGYTGNGSNMYLSSNFNVSTNSSHYQLNSSMYGYYGRLNTTAGTKSSMGASDAANAALFIPNTGTSTFVGYMNSAASFSTTNRPTQGLLVYQRTSATSVTFSINGSTSFIGTNASTALPTTTDFFLAANNNGPAAFFDTNQVTCAFRGNGAINMVLFNSAVNTLMLNLGAHY